MKTILNPYLDLENKVKLQDAIVRNDGYCPCAVEKTDDTECMCKEFREQAEPGLCHCGLYMKVEK